MTGKEIIERLCAAGYDAYLVGGAVRDKLAGRIPHDEDIVTSALPEEVLKIFHDRKTSDHGKSFKVVTVDGIEVATYRVERYNGLSDKDVDVKIGKSIIEDLSRRDLTINAMALDVDGNIIDPFNGREDLQNKV